MKTIIKVLIGLLVTGGVIGGAVYGAKTYNTASLEAEVVSVNNIGTSYWGDDISTYGYITSNEAQNVFVDASQKIADVYVEEGQTVAVGDKLIKLDITDNSLTIEAQKIAIQKTQNQIAKAKQELERLQAGANSTDYSTPASEVASVSSLQSQLSQAKKDLAEWKSKTVSTASGDASGNAGVPQDLKDDMIKLYTEDIASLEDAIWYAQFSLSSTIEQKRQLLTELDIELRSQQLTLSQLQSTSGDGIIYAEVEGTVKNLQDPDNRSNDGSAFLVVSASDGLYIKGQVSELNLDAVAPGTYITGSTWNTGLYFSAQIQSIDENPIPEDYYYSDGAEASNYYFTAYIDDASGLMNGEGAQITISSSDDNGSGLYLEKALVRKESGQSYVMKRGEDGKLVKQYVETGKTIWGSYIEIKSGLTYDDYIAFPYGKTAKEGVSTKEVDYFLY